jgi:protein phosphatase
VALLALAGLGIGYRTIRNYYYVNAYADTVAIMRGIQGSILGVRLQQPYLLGCLNDRGELSQVSYGQGTANPGCALLRLNDLRPSGRAQVTAGLPAGSLDDAIAQLRELARGSLLPLCALPKTSSPATSTAPRSGSGPPAAGPRSTTAMSSPPAPAPLPVPQQQPGIDCRAAA